ncbi:MAG: transglycosylase domain-containing protein [Chloroflexota bacterium]|nr:transglycosylase domain-containing protein [Chloroflexota bacterium]
MATIAQVIRRRRRRVERRAVIQAQRQRWIALAVGALVLFGVLPLMGMLGTTIFFYANATQNLPTPTSSLVRDPALGTTELYDRSGATLLYAVQDPLGDDRQLIPLESLPPYVRDATLLTEDPDFLTTAGFYPIGVFLRMWSHLLFDPLPPDPSLTGRLVRNVILPQTERVSNDDRLREIILVAELNRRYTPEQLLEWHLNTNYYGNEAYGIDAAAQLYLGKRAADLALDEAALLAAIPTAPQYNPFDNAIAARGRQQDLLRTLLNNRFITQAQYDDAIATVTVVRTDSSARPQIAADYLLYARAQAVDILNARGLDGARLLARGGLRITTALDLDLYQQADCVLATHLARLNRAAPPATPCPAASFLPTITPGSGDLPDSGALAIIDVATGELRAIVGDALTPAYQPGVTLQPFVYLQAFLGGYTPASMVLDIPSTLPGAQEGLIYTPQNPDGVFRGPLNLRDAMGAGLLPPAAQIAQEQGMFRIIRLAHQMGINSLDDTEQVLVLDQGGGVAALDVAYSYSVFASLGLMRGVPVEPIGRGYRVRDPVAVLRIETPEGETLWDYDSDQVSLNEVVVPERGLAYLVNDILADQRTRWSVIGQGTPLDLSRPGAVVNGIAGGQGGGRMDAWTAGYTPQYVISAHVGRAEGGALALDPFGLDGAAPVWRALMEYVHSRDALPIAQWQRPTNVIDVVVCERSGMLPNGACPPREEVFLDGMQALLQRDTRWEVVEINSRTRQRATVNTPAELRAEIVYFIPPQQALDWWLANNQPLPPEEYDSVSRPEILESAQILAPVNFDLVGGVVEVRGSIDASAVQSYQLSYGEGRNPTAWIDIGAPQTVVPPNGLLGTWDTTGLDGIYSILLTVIMQDGTSESQAVQVSVDNIAPTITLMAGASGQAFRWPGDRAIPLEAIAVDNLAMRSVEFYADGQFIGAAEQYPFAFNWNVPGVGTTTFTAVAFDQVGNRAEATITVEVLRSGA